MDALRGLDLPLNWVAVRSIFWGVGTWMMETPLEIQYGEYPAREVAPWAI